MQVKMNVMTNTTSSCMLYWYIAVERSDFFSYINDKLGDFCQKYVNEGWLGHVNHTAALAEWFRGREIEANLTIVPVSNPKPCAGPGLRPVVTIAGAADQ